MFKKLILSLGFLLCFAGVFAQQYPDRPTNSPVADFTNTLNDADKQKLDTKIKAFEDSTSNQIAVVIVQSVGDYDIIEYGNGLIRKWGIGQKDKNNGVLVLVALADRKMSVQTGYGLEGALPDIVTQEIIQNDMKPRFRESDYYGGLDAATDDIIKYTKGEYKSSGKKAVKGSNGKGGSAGIIVLIVIFVLILIFRNKGGGGGGRQIIGGRGGANPFWWLLAGSINTNMKIGRAHV